MNFGTVQCILLATVEGNVVYERFYDALTEAQKAEVRARLSAVSAPTLASMQRGQKGVGFVRDCCAVFHRISADLVLYAVGSGEYNELALDELLEAMATALQAACKVKDPHDLTEAAVCSKYDKLVLVVDEVVSEGIVDQLDTGAILSAIKMRS